MSRKDLSYKMLKRAITRQKKDQTNIKNYSSSGHLSMLRNSTSENARTKAEK
jgi:hypothetical protein